MSTHVCPWWLAYTFDNPLRRLIHPPAKVVGPYIEAGDAVMDVGCGMGHFSLGMARLVGPEGRVYAVDLQGEMLEVTMKRAAREGLEKIIEPIRCTPDSLGVASELDFALASWMLHEVPDQRGFLIQVRELLKPEGRFLFTEPGFHVKAAEMEAELKLAGEVGFEVLERPKVTFSHAGLVGPKVSQAQAQAASSTS